MMPNGWNLKVFPCQHGNIKACLYVPIEQFLLFLDPWERLQLLLMDIHLQEKVL